MIQRRVIPIIKAETLIPKGMYCYEALPENGKTLESTGARQIKACQFWSINPAYVNPVTGCTQLAGYCSYLKAGDWMSREEGGTMLLWDQVKECGIKFEDEDDAFYLDERQAA